VADINVLIAINLVTPKAAAKHERLINKVVSARFTLNNKTQEQYLQYKILANFLIRVI
jgi:hypothetical protein